MNDIVYQYWFCCLNKTGVATRKKLLKHFGSPKAIFEADYKILDNLSFLKLDQKEEIKETRHLDWWVRAYDQFISNGYSFIYEDSPLFPKRLKDIYHTPQGLFVKGKLPDESLPSIAIVGARSCSNYGRSIAKKFASTLGQAGVSIISGMALGIDGAAHRGVLENEGDTYAVLGCGIDICYPRENRDIYTSIQNRGGLISEYPPGRSPLPWQFPMRNRLIAGLADGVLIVEARKKSGSLITADMALEQGKDVFVIPGRIGDSLSEGCMELVKTGAGLVTKVEDILEELELGVTSSREENNICLAETEKLVYSSLCLIPKYIEDIVNQLHIDLKTCISVLYKLEKLGLVKQIYKNQYVLIP